MSPYVIISHYGYFGVIIALILEFLLIPFPAETILVISGVMWHKGLFQLWPLIIIATAGSWVGSLIGYFIGSYVGRPVLLRYGKYVKLDEAKLVKAEHAFRRYSIAILGIGRFIAGIRVMIAYVAGMNKMGLGLYMFVTLISAALWSSAFILVGATIGAKWNFIVGLVKAHPRLSIVAGVIVVALVAVFWWRKRTKKLAKSDTMVAETEI